MDINNLNRKELQDLISQCRYKIMQLDMKEQREKDALMLWSREDHNKSHTEGVNELLRYWDE